MPSPFPGMNPYLEEPDGWGNVHIPIIVYAEESLQPYLLPKYVARSDAWFDSEEAESLEEHPHRFIGIWDLDEKTLVTVIEFLTPSLKNPKGVSNGEYHCRRNDLLAAGVNVVEIDLLRGGLPSMAVETDVNVRVPPHDYLVSVSRSVRRDEFEVYPFGLREELPRVAIPLRFGDPDIGLDLPALLNRVYDNGAFGRLIDYRQVPPLPPLNENDAAWLDALLREKSLRAT